MENNNTTIKSAITTFDEDETWSIADDPLPYHIDLMSLALHEIGHTLGLDHSNRYNAVMYPYAGSPIRELSDDDKEAIRSLYGSGFTDTTKLLFYDRNAGHIELYRTFEGRLYSLVNYYYDVRRSWHTILNRGNVLFFTIELVVKYTFIVLMATVILIS